jgi:glycosyl transferase, family 25
MRVFVINLARSKERRARMKELLDSMGVEFEFFAGTDGKKLTPAEVEDAYDEAAVLGNIRRTLTLNEIGCTISHRAVYRKIRDEGIGRACILEDDILLDPEFPEVLAYLDSRPLRNTVVKLDNYQEKSTPCGLWTRERIRGPYRYKRPVTTQWMAWGYAMDAMAAESILRAWPSIAFMSDDWKRMSAAVEIRCVQPAVVHQNAAFESIIDEDRKAHLEKSKETRRRSLNLGRLAHIAKTLAKMAVS